MPLYTILRTMFTYALFAHYAPLTHAVIAASAAYAAMPYAYAAYADAYIRDMRVIRTLLRSGALPPPRERLLPLLRC